MHDGGTPPHGPDADRQDRDLAFVVSQADGRPMYRQIMNQIQQRVAVGDWPEGYALPSIRELAAALRVSVITVKRAYHELEREGVIVTQRAKGSYVAPGSDLRSGLQRAALDRLLKRSLELARLHGVHPDELAERLLELSRAPTITSERK